MKKALTVSVLAAGFVGLLCFSIWGGLVEQSPEEGRPEPSPGPTPSPSSTPASIDGSSVAPPTESPPAVLADPYDGMLSKLPEAERMRERIQGARRAVMVTYRIQIDYLHLSDRTLRNRVIDLLALRALAARDADMLMGTRSDLSEEARKKIQDDAVEAEDRELARILSPEAHARLLEALGYKNEIMDLNNSLGPILESRGLTLSSDQHVALAALVRKTSYYPFLGEAYLRPGENIAGAFEAFMSSASAVLSEEQKAAIREYESERQFRDKILYSGIRRSS